MKDYIELHIVFKSTLIRVLRFFSFACIAALVIQNIVSGVFPKFPLFVLGVFVIFEIFVRFKIAKTNPFVTINQNNGGDIYNSFTRLGLYAAVGYTKTEQIIKHLVNCPSVAFILEKASISSKELPFLDVPKKDFLHYSFEIAKYMRGDFVTTGDMMVAYLFIIEPYTKILFTKELKKEETILLLKAARNEFSEEEHPRKTRFSYLGGGIGDSLISGWTPNTQKYTRDTTYKSLSHRPFLNGRKKEFAKMLEVLSKKENNNVLLVGERGSGKDTLVEALAYKSFIGVLQENLSHKKILELLTGLFVSGTGTKSELETRLSDVIAEISHAGNVMLFIPELQNVIGGSNLELDITGTMMPYLKDGAMPLLATMTPGAYKKYMEENPLEEVFEVIHINEPDFQTALKMLFQKSDEISYKNGVSITYKAIVAAIDFSTRFLQDAVLPGSAVYLLEDTAHSVALSYKDKYGKKYRGIVTKNDVIKTIESKTNISVATPTGAEKELLLHLEDELHKRVVDQVEGITVISEALRRIRTGLSQTNKPISFLFLGPTGVGKTETAKAIASLYFHGEDKMIRLDMSEYVDEVGVKRLLGAGPGEGSDRGEFTDKVRENPFSLILLDEFEKAHPKILDLFLQVLEDGRLTDNKGRTVSFINSIIIATSNAGSDFIRGEIKKSVVDKEFHKRLLDFLQSQHIFKPELLNRFDAVVTFKPLGQAEVTQITAILIDKLVKKLKDGDITLSFDESVIRTIVKEGSDEEFGARPLRRYIQDNIEDILAQKMLKGEIQRGDTAIFSADSLNTIKVVVTRR